MSGLLSKWIVNYSVTDFKSYLDFVAFVNSFSFLKTFRTSNLLKQKSSYSLLVCLTANYLFFNSSFYFGS